jgi:hypothetical protein
MMGGMSKQVPDDATAAAGRISTYLRLPPDTGAEVSR